MQRRRNNRYNQDNRFVLNNDSYSGYRSGQRYNDEDDYNNSRYYSSSSRHNADEDYDDSDYENENEGDYESSHGMYGNQGQNNGVWYGNSENYHQQDRDLNREKGFGNNYSKLSNLGYGNQSQGGDIVMLDMTKEIMIRGNVKVPDFIAAEDAIEIEMKIVQLCVREMEEILLIRAGIGSSIKEA
jgi:hypothetical protein